MKRILVPLVIAAALAGPPAHAATAEAIVSELRAQGYSQIEVRRTLLGRTRIVATSPGYDREIVLNPSTGVILRDLMRVRNTGGSDGPSSLVSGSGSRDGSGGSGSSRDDFDDDDDSSGGGGSGGGSGGGGSDDNDDDGSSGGGDSGGGSDDNDDGDSGGSDSGGDDSDDDDD
jgi:hypothetical protein